MALACLTVSTLIAQISVNTKPAKGSFQTLQITRFEVDPKVGMSNERLNVLMLEVADELFKIKRFKDIVEPSTPYQSSGKGTDAQLLHLTGYVSDYYSVLPEESDKAISSLFARVRVTVKFTDDSGNVLLEQEIGKHVIYPLSFGDVTRKLGKEIAHLAKTNFF